MPIKLMDLPFAMDALEPHLDAQTMQIHHGKHHAAYVNNLNAALDKHPALYEKPLEDILRNLSAVPEDIRTAVRNHGGGVANHNFYWQGLSASGGGRPSGELARAIDATFGGFDAFQELFNKTAVGRFGSGWGWLIVNPEGKIEVCATPNQDSPIMKGVTDSPGEPLLVVDVWEHAYYLKYQNRRPDFVGAWWNVIDWPRVEELYQKAQR